MTETFTAIARFDEAIDHEATPEAAKAKYREEFDPTGLVFLDGQQPTRFHCRRLRTSEMREVLTHPNAEERYVAAFARGLVRVDGLRTEAGVQVWTRPTDKPLNEKSLDQFDIGDVLEIGAMIYGRSVLGKGRPAAWPLPATSQSALEALAHRRAVETMRARRSAPSNGQAPAASPAATSPSSATYGPATATASTDASPTT